MNSNQPYLFPRTINDALSNQFPQLGNLTREEMIELLQDDVYFDATFNTLLQATTLHQTTEEGLRRTIELAQRNESLRPGLEALRQETSRLFNEANALKVQWSHLEQAQADEAQKFSRDAQLARLRSAKVFQEYQSEALVKSFIEGKELDEEGFANQYLESRKIYYKRAHVLDKWEAGKVDWKS